MFLFLSTYYLILSLFNDVIEILLEAGDEGLRLRKLIVHVYNKRNSLFHDISKEQVRNEVTAFIRANSKSKDDLITKTRWGVYRINTNSLKFKNQRTLFSELPLEEKPTETKTVDASPSLFDN